MPGTEQYLHVHRCIYGPVLGEARVSVLWGTCCEKEILIKSAADGKALGPQTLTLLYYQ